MVIYFLKILLTNKYKKFNILISKWFTYSSLLVFYSDGQPKRKISTFHAEVLVGDVLRFIDASRLNAKSQNATE